MDVRWRTYALCDRVNFRAALPIIDYILVDPFKRTRDGKGTFDIASFGVNPDFHAAALFVEYFEGSCVHVHGGFW